MSGACLSTLCAWKVIDFHDTTEKNRLPSFYNPGSVLELDWGNQSVIKCFLCLSDFKTTFSDVMSVPLGWKNTVFPILSTPSWFISFEAFSLISDWAPFEVGIHCFLQSPDLQCLRTMTRHKRGTWQFFKFGLPCFTQELHLSSLFGVGTGKDWWKDNYLLLQLGIQPYFFSIQIRATIK